MKGGICRLLVLVMGLAILASLTGCASGGSRRSRGKLSDATAEAAGKDKESELVQNRAPTENEIYPSQSYEEIYKSNSQENELSQPSSPPVNIIVTDSDNSGSNEEDVFGLQSGPSILLSQSNLAGDAIRGFTSFTIMYGGFPADRIRLDLGLYYGHGRRGSQQNIQEGIDSIDEVGVEVNGRYYFTPDHTLVGIFVLGGFRWGLMRWSYTNDIEWPNEDGGIDRISNDMVEMWTYFIGLGTSLLQTKVLHLGACATAGVRVSNDLTFEDFDNDVFKDVGEIRLSLVACIIF